MRVKAQDGTGVARGGGGAEPSAHPRRSTQQLEENYLLLLCVQFTTYIIYIETINSFIF